MKKGKRPRESLPFHRGVQKKTRQANVGLPVHRLPHAGRTFDVEHLVGAHATCNKMPITLSALCLVTLTLCNVHGSLEHEIPRRSFLSRRDVDGTRGRKYFDPEEEGAFDSYGSAGGQYDPYQEKTDFSDIRRNVPGEPGIDYPAYTTLPQTGFTCEERSRGYYADEVSGCQVFHVCHDVLISSFLCPIGSIFSQRLLTCDWWTKVDCPSSSKYIGVNRNSYQQDDDEMIRNAYAMVSLQSGTDVTKDGLVDPDRTGSVIDYQRNPGRILDYSLIDTTGNDLRSSFDDYLRPNNRNFLRPYQLKDRKIEAGRSYDERYYSEGKSRSPYADSPIIRVQKISDPNYGDPQRHKDFPDNYRRPNEFTNQFQPSYAPTVPTVTTTTRRFYSPTVPTTFRPSTLAYNKLDQDLLSSDYYFSRSRTKGFVTPPTTVFPSGDKGGQDFRRLSLKKLNRDDDYGRHESYEDDYEDHSDEGRTERSRERFQIKVPENYNLNGTLSGRSTFFDGVYEGFDRARDDEELVDDFESRGSIGLGHALQKSFRGISVQEQNPVKDATEDVDKEEVNHRHTLARPGTANYSGEIKGGTAGQYKGDSESKSVSDVSVSSTTPSVIESTIKASTSPHQLIKSTDVEEPIERMDHEFNSFKPTVYLEPPEEPRSKFQIKVPDLSDMSTLLIRYSTADDSSPGSRTTALPRFPGDDIDQANSFHGHSDATNNNGNSEDSRGSSYQHFPTTVARPLISSTGSWYASSNSDELDLKAPERNYSDGSKNLTSLENNFNTADSVQNLNKTSPSLVIESSGYTFNPVTHRSIDESKRKSQEKPENKPADAAEASTANALFGPIKSETLQRVEAAIDKNNSPYQVTFTVNKDEELAVTGGDLIGKLIAERDKGTATSNDRVRELEIIKSVEPAVHGAIELETTAANTLDRNESKPVDNLSSVVDDLKKKKNFSTVSLLQLMSELLKLDKVPRPFSLSNSQSSEFSSVGSRMIAKDINSNINVREEIATKSKEGFTESETKSSAPKLKEQILGQLTENFGEPIYKKDRLPTFHFSDKERSIDFNSEFPLEKEEVNIKDNIEGTVSTVPQENPEVVTSTQRTVLTTESGKTVVRTEFVPSIGFSLDTDEGREEYVEAVLGGLIEPQTAESEKRGMIFQGKVVVESLSRRNETSGRI